MGLLDRFRATKRQHRRVLAISIDGTPYTLIQRLIAAGRLPHFANLIVGGSFRRMNSVYPTVSSVAWSSFMTGQNPGLHGIFGFVDRDPATLKTTIPTAKTMKSRTLWEILSDAGRRVVVINVPLTYPPRPVNGILISCFLTPSLDKVAYPPDVVDRLKSWGYRIDTDPWVARESKDKLLADVNDTFERRVKTMFHLMDEEEWDYFHCHIMETDRLFHFLWEQMEEDDPVYASQFLAFIERVDAMLGQVMGRLDDQTTMMVLSDHGFCTLQSEVYVNHWLSEQGWLHFETDEPKSIADMSPDSIAYSLDPGRIFINLSGREVGGRVAPEDYEDWRRRIAEAAMALRAPETGQPIFRGALRREEIYHGPWIEEAADLILAPHNGFDPKGALGKNQLTFKGPALVGMHTYDDALLAVAGQQLQSESAWIGDVMPTILEIMEVPAPADLDGHSLISPR